MEFLFWIGSLILIILAYLLGRYLRSREILDHRRDAISRSRSILSGQFSEQIAPYLPGFLYKPTECKFLGKPVDFIAFKGLDSKKVDEVVFVEVKSGKSSLTNVQKSLKEAVEKKNVKWEEYKVDEGITGA